MTNYNIKSNLKNVLLVTSLTTASFLGNDLYAQKREHDDIRATYNAKIPSSIDSSRCSLFLKDYIALNNSGEEKIVELTTPENSATIKFKPGFYTKQINYELNDSSKSIELRDEIIALLYVQKGIQAFYFTRNNSDVCTIKHFEQLQLKDGDVVLHQSALEKYSNPSKDLKKIKNSKFKGLLSALF